MNNSEFPETRLSKITQRFGWIISPLLFLSLIAFTFFVAQGLQLDLKGNIERKGSIHIKEVNNAFFDINGKRIGKAGEVYDSTQTGLQDEPLTVKVTKEGRKDWVKNVKPKEGYVSVFLPIMYPNNMDFSDEEISAHRIYQSKNPNQFFYDKIENGKLILYRYTILKQVFILQNRNERIADISNQVLKTPLLSSTTLPEQAPDSLFNNYQVVTSNQGRFSVIVIPDGRIYIVNESGKITEVANVVPRLKDKFIWAPQDNALLLQNGQEILSIDPNTAATTVVYRPNSNEIQTDLQFVETSTLVYKVKNNSGTDLIENNFQGNATRTIDLPNIESIRKDNLKKAYNMLEKHGLILIQTESNIYAFNQTTSEIKKFNKFDSEEIVYVDSLKSTVLTRNTKTQNQFRYYNLEMNESKTFIFDQVKSDESPQNIYVYNKAQNVIFTYSDRVIFSDIDGTNQFEYKSSKNVSVVAGIKEDVSVVLVLSLNNSDSANDTRINIKFERFEN